MCPFPSTMINKLYWGMGICSGGELGDGSSEACFVLFRPPLRTKRYVSQIGDLAHHNLYHLYVTRGGHVRTTTCLDF